MKKLTGDEAKRAREAAGASQIEIAQAVGINRTYYSLFEAGRYVLDDAEQARLGDALTDHGYTPDDDDDEGPEPSARTREPAKVQTTGLTPDQIAIARAKTALINLRAAVPRGLQSVRVAHATEAAAGALAGLDYADLLQLANENNLATDGLVPLGEFSGLDLDGMQAWEARAAGVLMCAILYGDAWQSACFDTLKDAEDDLRAILDGEQLAYRQRGFLDSLFGDGEAHCPNRRADLAPYFVRAAIQRKAPNLAKQAPDDSAPNDEAA